MNGNFTVAVLLAVLAPACGAGLDDSPGVDGTTPGDGASEPWLQQFVMGNTSVNSAPITTNQDGVSHLIIDDFVLEGALPATELEFFTIHVYVPVDASVTTTVSSGEAELVDAQGGSSGDIFMDAEALSRTQLGDTLYGTYRLTARDSRVSVTRAEFANFHFSFDLEYADAMTHEVVDVSHRTVGFYKR